MKRDVPAQQPLRRRRDLRRTHHVGRGAHRDAIASLLEKFIADRDQHETTRSQEEDPGDTARLDFIEGDCVELRCKSSSNGDDADVYFEAVKFYMAIPKERVVGYGSTARGAIDFAMENDDDRCAYCNGDGCTSCRAIRETESKPVVSVVGLLDRKVTVCDKCLCACCWQGEFMCDDAKGAGTVDKTVRELFALNAPCVRENSEYWFKDPSTGFVDYDAKSDAKRLWLRENGS